MSEDLFEQLKTLDAFKGLPYEELEHIVNLTARLQRATLFQSLNSQELALIAQCGRLIHRERGDVIIQEGSTDRIFYVVLKGEVRAYHVEESGRRKLLNYHEAGDFFGELIFLTRQPRAATVDVVDDVDLVAFDQKGFDCIVQYEQISDYLRNWGRERIRRSNREFEGKHWDEISVVLAHKNWVALAQVILLPIVITLLTWTTMVLLLLFAAMSRDVVISVVVAVTIGMSLWIFWMWEDWRNDDFIVTSKRIIHIERILAPPFPSERHEVPIEQVQDITSRNHGLWTWLFKVRSLEIKTSGAGIIQFPYLEKAEQIQEEIFRARDLARIRRHVEEQGRIRHALLQEIGREVKSVSPLESGETVQVTPEREGLLKWIDYFIPRARVVKLDQIIWRKHWIILAKEIALPSLLFFLSLALLIPAIARPGILGRIPWYITLAPPALGMIGSFGWYLWQYDGWRNDVYIVTNSRIIDIEGSPFHLHKESRTEGTFDVIQNTDYHSPNWISRILRIGDVTISTAAKEAAFTFTSVARPEEVQQEIFKRVTAFREKQEREENERQYREFTKWFGIYHRSAAEYEE
jgi:membrane protein YdbS with pleckstrin-like domain